MGTAARAALIKAVVCYSYQCITNGPSNGPLADHHTVTLEPGEEPANRFPVPFPPFRELELSCQNLPSLNGDDLIRTYSAVWLMSRVE